MASKPDPLPFVSDELLAYFERMYPERCPDIGWDDRKIWFYTGQRSIVRFLKTINEAQREAALGAKLTDVFK